MTQIILTKSENHWQPDLKLINPGLSGIDANIVNVVSPIKLNPGINSYLELGLAGYTRTFLNIKIQETLKSIKGKSKVVNPEIKLKLEPNVFDPLTICCYIGDSFIGWIPARYNKILVDYYSNFLLERIYNINKVEAHLATFYQCDFNKDIIAARIRLKLDFPESWITRDYTLLSRAKDIRNEI